MTTPKEDWETVAEQALKLAIAFAGGPYKLANLLNTALPDKKRITGNAVTQWKIVPPLRVLLVEKMTGVPRHKLRPDLYPPESREP